MIPRAHGIDANDVAALDYLRRPGRHRNPGRSPRQTQPPSPGRWLVEENQKPDSEGLVRCDDTEHNGLFYFMYITKALSVITGGKMTSLIPV
uniref:Transposase n=1 Tax=Steinernema glaseri TaxID=37863 RepID=A0A1I7ZTI7_9BILA